ncbi:hypothetical protein [Fluviicola taffensis]|uniref:hypothetical protein n=1 Tax=Fluviicola taffensis TaxID=191579 RepID=UPI0031380218
MTKLQILILLILLPISAFAHGVEVLVSFFYDLLTFVALTVFIALIKWKSAGKTLLGIILIVSTLIAIISTSGIPYDANRRGIELIMCGVPLVSVLSVYFIFRRKFRLKKAD